jgi:AraC-like DNA-binding protein
MLGATTQARFRPISPEQYVDISERVCPMRYETSDSSLQPTSRLRGHQIGAVSLVRYESQGLEHGTRTLEHIRATPFDYFMLCLPLQAQFEFVHAGLESQVVEGSAVLLTAQRPFDAYVSGISGSDHHSSIELRIPGALLRSRAPHVDHFCNRAFAVDSGAGAILRALLTASLDEASDLTSVQAGHFGRALADLIGACIEGLEGRDTAPGESASFTDNVFDRAMAFIECQLSAANLDTELVARHCHVSPRYLHKIFSQRSTTVAGQIREMRLQCCRHALLDPRLFHRPIIEIACSWGFSDPSHFGRLYRKHFGRSPSEERAHGAIGMSN